MLPFVPASFGDIVAAANLALSIYNALRDSTGSSYEYQCLIDEIHSFERALRFVDHAITVTPPSGRLASDIAAETATCHNLLKTFLDGIKSYQKTLGGGAKGPSWRKIGWSLLKADEVANFRQKLSQHKHNIVVFLNGLTIVLAVAYAEETRQISASINEGFLALQKRLPPRVGYGDGNSVTLINAFGERVLFPWEYCFSQDRFHETLINYFNGKCGQDDVERHDYRISTEDGRSLVGGNNWNSVVKKGIVLVMSMVVKKIALQSKLRRRQTNSCPHCYETNIGIMPDNGWLQCRHCERRFGSNYETIFCRDPPSSDNSFTVYRNTHVVLVERLLRFSFEESPRFLLRQAPREQKAWEKVQAQEANRFIELS